MFYSGPFDSAFVLLLFQHALCTWPDSNVMTNFSFKKVPLILVSATCLRIRMKGQKQKPSWRREQFGEQSSRPSFLAAPSGSLFALCFEGRRDEVLWSLISLIHWWPR